LPTIYPNRVLPVRDTAFEAAAMLYKRSLLIIFATILVYSAYQYSLHIGDTSALPIMKRSMVSRISLLNLNLNHWIVD
jgi:hypothetical protein